MNKGEVKGPSAHRCVFPGGLQSRLKKIPFSPLTLVEAPSGFGKTTAVREYLRDFKGEAVRQCWYTCFGERPAHSWEGFCRLLGTVDLDGAQKLKKLFPPSLDTLPDMTSLMESITCEGKTFLVIDNFQLFDTEIPRGVVQALAGHGKEDLHIIIITQPLPWLPGDYHREAIHTIGARDLFFDRKSTALLCRQSGIKASDKDLDYIQSVSEGWVSAILLQVAHFRNSGAFARVPDMDSLIERAFWDRLPSRHREFLLAVSLLENFSPAQGALMGGWDSLPKDVLALLKNNYFIAYVPEKGAFSLHGILKEYLEKEFSCLPSSTADSAIRRAAVACKDEGKFLEGAKFFFSLRDYEAVLSMPFTSKYLNEQKEKEIMDFLEKLVEDCPEETLKGHPFTLLLFAFYFMMSGKRPLFSRLTTLLQDILQAPGCLPEKDLARLRGETALLLSFTEFNDIARMSARHREALDWLSAAGGAAEAQTVIFGKTPWPFGIPSVLTLYWSSPGKLDEDLALMDECIPWYGKLSGGHGTGADSVMRAEACLYRGSVEDGEALSHKAIYLAGSAGQASISLCGELVLARLALLRGDGEGYLRVRENIQKYKKGSTRAESRMAELCLAYLDLSLGRVESLPDWMGDAQSIRNVLFIQGQPFGFMILGKILYLERRFPEFYGLAEGAMELSAKLRYVLPSIWFLAHLAGAKVREGDSIGARGCLEKALDLALPDKVWLPFGETGPDIFPLLQSVLSGRKGDNQGDLSDRCRSYTAAVASVKVFLQPKPPSHLTPREREIALLAREWLTVGEIGARLFISENTVKSALKTIYGKLDIHSRGELTQKEL